MMNLRTGLGLALLALLLGACNGLDGGLVDFDISARTSTEPAIGDEAPQLTERLAPGETVVRSVEVSSQGGDALYLYLDESLELSVENGFGSLLAFSARPDYFTSHRVVGLDADAAALRPADIGVNQTCPGSCVILPNRGANRYLEIHNSTSSTVTVGVYAVLRDFEDGNEYQSHPIALPGGVTRGAIETLGDVDEFEVQTSGTLFLDPGQQDSAIPYEARISDPTGVNPTRTITAGESEQVSTFEIVRVQSGGSTERAGVSGASKYTLDLQTD
ncbi:MAG: hypothetical protein U5K81_07845 [Trueperaceae bacterium]|nr:hypothetical protein [Trueperaceae bacterium]